MWQRNEPDFAVRRYQEEMLMPMLNTLKPDEYLHIQDCAIFLNTSIHKMRHHVIRMPGFPLRVIGAQKIIPRKQLQAWLYRHPAGIEWRKQQEAEGKIGELDWRRYRSTLR